MAATASSSFSSRKKADTFNLKQLQLPTLARPQTDEELANAKSIAESGVLLLSLMQSRQAWTTSIFQKYRPDPQQQPKRSNHSRKKWPHMRSLGTCTLTIGPHTFYETVFYEATRTEIVEEPAPALPGALASASAAAVEPGVGSGTVVQQRLDFPNAINALTGVAVVPAAGHAQGAITEAEQGEAMEVDSQPTHDSSQMVTEENTLPELQAPEAVHTLKPVVVATPVSDAASSSSQVAPSAQPAFPPIWPTEPGVQDPSAAHAILPLAVALNLVPVERRLIEHYDVVFEFQENVADRFIFPKDAIIEATSMSAPFEIIASFHLPASDASSHAFFKDHAHQHNPRKLHQATTVRISGMSPEVLAAVRRAVNDVTTVYGGMIEKMRHLPNHAYMQYQLPADLPSGLIEEMGVKALLAPPTTSVNGPSRYAKRTSDVGVDARGAKRSRLVIGIEDEASRKFPGKLTTSRTTSRTGLGFAAAAAVNPLILKPDDGGLKKCAYCGSRSTPMWRRGPGGAGTLCNACGVKWKHGKILQGPAAGAAIADALDAFSSATSTPTTKAKVKRHSVSGGTGAAKGKRAASEEEGEPPKIGGKRTAHHGEAVVSVDGVHLLLQKQEYARAVAAQLHAESAGGGEALGGAFRPLERGAGKGVAPPLKKRFSAKAIDQANQVSSSAAYSAALASSSVNVAAIAAALAANGGDVNQLTVIAALASARSDNLTPISAQALYHSLNNRSSAALPPPISSVAAVSPATLAISGNNVLSNLASVRPMAVAPTSTTASASLRPPLHTFHPVPSTSLQQHTTSALSSTGTVGNGTAPTSRLMSSAPAPTAAPSAPTSSNPVDSSGIPLPTLSIAFGPQNAYFTHPNCGVTLFDDHFQIRLQKEGHDRTGIDVWKESVEASDFEILREGADGREVLLMRAVVAQYLTRFGSELLNPERGETVVVFRFLEKLDPNGGAVVRRILERWLGLQQHGYGLGAQAGQERGGQQRQTSPQGGGHGSARYGQSGAAQGGGQYGYTQR